MRESKFPILRVDQESGLCVQIIIHHEHKSRTRAGPGPLNDPIQLPLVRIRVVDRVRARALRGMQAPEAELSLVDDQHLRSPRLVVVAVEVAGGGRVYPDGGQADGRPARRGGFAGRRHAVLDVRPVEGDEDNDDGRVNSLCEVGR